MINRAHNLESSPYGWGGVSGGHFYGSQSVCINFMFRKKPTNEQMFFDGNSCFNWVQHQLLQLFVSAHDLCSYMKPLLMALMSGNTCLGCDFITIMGHVVPEARAVKNP